MRRPAKTKAQKQHDKQQRALLRLRKAAVRYADHFDAMGENRDLAPEPNLHADLEAACCAYNNTLNNRERRRLTR